MGRDLDTVAKAIRAASISTDTRFLDIGRRLETSADILTALTRTFDTLSDEMKGDGLRLATQDLSQVARFVSALTPGGEAGAFRTLTALVTAIAGRLARMDKSIKGVGMLATNAKIAAAVIGDTSAEFMNFATEIRRTLGLAQASLDQFAAELAGVGRHLQAAAADQSALDARQATAIRTVPQRLAHSIGTVVDRGGRAGAIAATVGQRAQDIAKRIGLAVMALQVGDITRQRMEHVDYALGLVAEMVAQAGPLQPDAAAADDVATTAGFCCRLQAAQLDDTADELAQEIGQILTSLRDLARDARDILNLGHDAFGASGSQRGTFVGELEGEVAEVDALLQGYGAARRQADEVAASVSEATTRLARQIGTMRALEADIRIMGLNTSLRCGRLGAIGRPLSIIAQELRLYANEIAVEANGVMGELDQIAAIAASLSGQARDTGAADTAAMADVMTRSIARLGTAGQNLAAALQTLERDGETVVDLLQETVDRAAAHGEMGQVLRQAAADLALLAPGPHLGDVPARAEPLVALMARSYTMARERQVLDRYAPGKNQAPAAVPGPAATADDLEDIFF
ncbi:chemotaxis protein [Nitrospirillum bahiense]|uniref:Methyl-accepting chemotaxis protein n=1 Tax=Nitrospirillum amazonense TaxID=28077 RepID=A0A560G3K6_9PROT|nr:chemotaxis protein [Nitrospirillum amazonense]TWB28310.1 methyl-accepting chemotaxis protein [Nitrospirillum amazonense]